MKRTHLLSILLCTTIITNCGNPNSSDTKSDAIKIPIPDTKNSEDAYKGYKERWQQKHLLKTRINTLFASKDISELNSSFKKLAADSNNTLLKANAPLPAGVTLSPDQQKEVTRLRSLANNIHTQAKDAGLLNLELKPRPDDVKTQSSDYQNEDETLKAYENQISKQSAKAFKDFSSDIHPAGGRPKRTHGAAPDEATQYVRGIRHAVMELNMLYQKAVNAYNKQIAELQSEVTSRKQKQFELVSSIFKDQSITAIDTFVTDTNKTGSLEDQGFDFDATEDTKPIVDAIKAAKDNIIAGKIDDVANIILTALQSEGVTLKGRALDESNKDAALEAIKTALKADSDLQVFFTVTPEPKVVEDLQKEDSLLALSFGSIKDLSEKVSLRQARTAETGLVDARAFNMNGIAGQSIELGMPLFVQLKGDVSSAKSTEAATGSVTYRLGNTVIGAIQGYANSGAGFETDSSQLETSVVASHSFGSFFVEGQIGTVSANDVHLSDWSGYRSQITVGLDTEFVSPFVQVTHRQLDRSGLDLNETTGYVGLDMDIAKLAADTYSIDTRLLAKAGYGSKDWSSNSNDLGSTTGFSGSVEWSASLNLKSGVSFSSNLNLDTLAGSSAAVNVSLDR